MTDTLSILGKNWEMKEADWRQVSALAQKYDLPELIARLLVIRNIPDSEVEAFLEPTLRAYMTDPFQLKDMDKAVHRTIAALKNKEKIAIFGDYDVDGATSSALIYRFLSAVGLKARIYIPDRMQEGYGPTPQAMEILKGEQCGLVITLDCGTTAFAACEYAQELKLDVIVIDHHIAEPRLPPAVAVVNPNRLDEESVYKSCAAVGVAFLFIAAVNKKLREEGFYQDRQEPNLLQFLDLVAVGTVCDVVPLQGINRAFVRQGLKVLMRRENLGLKALADEANLSQAPTTYHLGFILGPRINAGGRVGQSGLGATLLSTDNGQEAQAIAQKLSTYNQERQAIEALVLAEAMQQAEQQDHPLIVTAAENWHPGVIGIVAGRLKERFNRPACVISIDETGLGKGSARSITGIDFGSMIQFSKQTGLLLGGGGHAMAGGFTICREKIHEFHQLMNTRILNSGADLTPRLRIDGTLALKAVTIEFVKSLEFLAPYGQGNPTPRFLFDNISFVKVDIVGQEHLRCILRTLDGTSLSAMAFRSVNTALGEALLKNRHHSFQLVGTLKLDEWQGRERVTLMIEDIAFMNMAVGTANVA